MSIELFLPDATSRSYPDGTTGTEVAESIGPRLAAAAVAISLNGQLLDLSRPLPSGGLVSIITESSEEGRQVLRHSTAHVLAQAVLSLFPGAHFAIGPAIEDGFYYDFDVGRPFTPDDVAAIQERMSDLIGDDQPFERQEVGKDEALAIFADQPFKKEIIDAVDPTEISGEGEVTLYRNDGFIDLCRGPHVPSTGRIKAFRLTRTAGAYWRGDEQRPQLQRIYGTAWESRAALDAYLQRLEEAERRDHRRLGPELDLFSFPRELGSGLAVWHPKGGLVRKVIEDYSRRVHLAHGYHIVVSPHVARSQLWKTSGHLNFYVEGMYPAIDLDEGDTYFVKPMNCPFHILIFRARPRSYRELPLRLYELGTVYRYERSGVLHGLLRMRGFTQDDSHIFCRRGQLADELLNLLEFTLMVLRDFGFEEFEADLSTRNPDKWMGDLDMWEEATEALTDALAKAGLNYRIAEGEAAFYGPKIDVHIKDAIGRRWQLTTLQVDFAQPENFVLDYAEAGNRKERPVMIHRALFGSVERFFGILVEHYAGAFPMWLAPVQVSIIPVADRHLDYARRVGESVTEVDLRAEVVDSDETVGEKIRAALTMKHPAVLVVGDKDVEQETVGFRWYGEDREQRGVALQQAVELLVDAARAPQ